MKPPILTELLTAQKRPALALELEFELDAVFYLHNAAVTVADLMMLYVFLVRLVK